MQNHGDAKQTGSLHVHDSIDNIIIETSGFICRKLLLTRARALLKGDAISDEHLMVRALSSNINEGAPDIWL